jgi:hypothetical protein
MKDFPPTASASSPFMAPDWLVTSIHDAGPGVRYRFYVEGENASARPIDRYFSWFVASVGDPRFVAHPDASPEVVAALAAAKRVTSRED